MSQKSFSAGVKNELAKKYAPDRKGLKAELCALLAKRALLREMGTHNGSPFYARLEQELLEKINALGIGPQGLGGRTTALAVHIEVAAVHMASLPVAVNINCHVTRHESEVL